MGEVGGDEGKEREGGSLEGGYDGQRGGEERTVLVGLEKRKTCQELEVRNQDLIPIMLFQI